MYYDPKSSLNYTYSAENYFYDVVDDPYFLKESREKIYNTLIAGMRPISFGDQLRRYIYSKKFNSENYEAVSDEKYSNAIIGMFNDNGTPASFKPTSSRLSSLAKNWIKQQTVNRNVVMLLGFGLGMTVDEVNHLLTKGIHEQILNPKDEFEAICTYCYNKKYTYPMYLDLCARYEKFVGKYASNAIADKIAALGVDINKTPQAYNVLQSIKTDEELFEYLMMLKHVCSTAVRSTPYDMFIKLYDKARELIARQYNESELRDRNSRVMDIEERLSNDDKHSDHEKWRRLDKARCELRIYKKSDIGVSDIEEILNLAQKGDSGNLLPLHESTLKYLLDGRRLSRQRLNEVLTHKSEVDRFDLITLSFFVFSLNPELFASQVQQYAAYVDETNKILVESSFGPLYMANPYECFIMMCTLTDDPLDTYTHVMAKSFGREI